MPSDTALPLALPPRLPSQQPGLVAADELLDDAGEPLLTDGGQPLLVAR
jgi:hypothetical protein